MAAKAPILKVKTFETQDGRQVIRSFHIPLWPDRDHSAGCLMVLDDITDFVEQRERRERMMDQLVSTILRVVGRQDPFTAEHAGRAAEMLQGVEFDGNVAETIRQAHERWDGEGEPRVLKGEAILESARVVAVADAFTGMISARAHRPGLSLDKAEEIISSLAGTSLDRKPVTALLFHLENGGGCGDWGDFAVPPTAAE